MHMLFGRQKHASTAPIFAFAPPVFAVARAAAGSRFARISARNAAPSQHANKYATPFVSPAIAGSRHCILSRSIAFHGIRLRHRSRKNAIPSLPPISTPCMHGSVWDAGAPCSSSGGISTSGSDHASNTGCSSSNSCTHSTSSPSKPERSTAVERILADILRLRQSLSAALLSAACLALASAFHLLRLSTAVVRTPLLCATTLTLIPALLDCVLLLYRTRLAAMGVNALMTLAAVVCVFTGALFEGALLTTLYALSNAAEHAVTERARRDLSALRDLVPHHALRLPGARSTDHATRVPIADIIVGDFVLVRAGEVAPCDGDVAHGPAFIAVPHLTGESTPRAVAVGDPVPAGARTLDAPLVLRVTRVGAESSIARIARLVTEAQENRPLVARFFDRFGRIYARAVLATAAAIAILLPVAPAFSRVPFGGHSGSAKRALGFLVATSPCALVIGAPIAYLAALSACTRRGILVKAGARAIEDASRASAVVFDKTGTLTTGRLAFAGVAAVSTAPANTRADAVAQPRVAVAHKPAADLYGPRLRTVVGAAAALERGAVHPLASAILEYAAALEAPLPEAHAVRAVPGQGVEGTLTRETAVGDLIVMRARIGRAAFVAPEALHARIAKMKESAAARGETATVLELGDEYYVLRFRDEVREGARDAVASLVRRGNDVAVLTGDGRGAATHVAGAVGAQCEVVCEATPERKLEFLQDLSARVGRRSRAAVMVGDGVNDAPALAAAHVGVACGLSSATAVHAADVVLVREQLDDLVWFLEKSSQTQAIVKQNIIIALILMVSAAGTVVGGSLPLWLCVIMHEGGTVLVGVNGLRLLR